MLDGRTVVVGASVGLAFAVGSGEHVPADLLERADVAMYAAKQGRSDLDRDEAGAARARPAPVPRDDAARVRALESLDVIGAPSDDLFEDLAQLAASICETPMAAITLVGGDRVWAMAAAGLERGAMTPRDETMCAHAIVEPDVLMVADTLTDDRFRHQAYVTGDPAIRFYVGAPLRSDDDHAIGALYVLDNVPRQLRPDQVEALRALGRQVVFHLERRRSRSSEREPVAAS